MGPGAACIGAGEACIGTPGICSGGQGAGAMFTGGSGPSMPETGCFLGLPRPGPGRRVMGFKVGSILRSLCL